MPSTGPLHSTLAVMSRMAVEQVENLTPHWTKAMTILPPRTRYWVLTPRARLATNLNPSPQPGRAGTSDRLGEQEEVGRDLHEEVAVVARDGCPVLHLGGANSRNHEEEEGAGEARHGWAHGLAGTDLLEGGTCFW